jgi:FkbM family methyltransferase
VDLVVREAFFDVPDYRGIIIEVGAAKPDYLSISASFRKLGWRAIAVEPNPVFAQLHRALGHEIIECACGESDQESVPFFVVENRGEYLGGTVSNESFSSLGIRGRFADLMGTVDTSTKEIRVQLRRLDTVLSELQITQAEVDILCIDVEGWELEVLSGLSPEGSGPKILIVENLFGEAEYVNAIIQRGYRLWQRIEPNDVFVRIAPPMPKPHLINGVPMMLDENEAIQASMIAGTYETEETGWVKDCLGIGSVFIDVGANFGWFTTFALSVVGPTGRVFAFEPSPLAFATLQGGLKQETTVHLYNLAVGKSAGHVHLFLPTSGNLHSPSVFPSPGKFKELRVPIVTLDSLPELWSGPAIDLVKIDVEGCEPDVLAGMEQLVGAGRIKRVIVEYNSWWLRANHYSVERLQQQFADAGFVEDRATRWVRSTASGGDSYELRSVLYKQQTA